MSISVTWANPEHTAVHLEFHPGWSWDELRAAIQSADDLITSVKHTVNLMIDIRNAGGLPRDFMRFASEALESGEARTNEGMKIVVGAGWLIQGAYNTFQKVYGGRMQNRPFIFARSLEEAYAMLEGA